MFLFSCLHAFIPRRFILGNKYYRFYKFLFSAYGMERSFPDLSRANPYINSLTRFRKLETGKGCCTLYAVCTYKFLYIPDLYEPCFLSYLCVSVTYKVMPVHIMDKTEQLS